MLNMDLEAREELLESLHQRIRTEKSLLQRRLNTQPPQAEEPAGEEAPAPARRTGRLYQVFLALSAEEAELPVSKAARRPRRKNALS